MPGEWSAHSGVIIFILQGTCGTTAKHIWLPYKIVLVPLISTLFRREDFNNSEAWQWIFTYYVVTTSDNGEAAFSILFATDAEEFEQIFYIQADEARDFMESCEQNNATSRIILNAKGNRKFSNIHLYLCIVNNFSQTYTHETERLSESTTHLR